VAFELVLAYSVSPEAMLGGCDYRQRLFTRNNWGLGPVVGVGVISPPVPAPSSQAGWTGSAAIC